MLTLGERLEAAIKASGKTAAQVARDAGTSARNVSNIVTGANANPKYQLLVKIAQAAKTTLGALNGESIQLSPDDKTALTGFRDWIDGKLATIDALTEPNAEIIPASEVIDRAMRIADGGWGATLTLRALGDSMTGDGILSGDTLYATTTRRTPAGYALGKIIVCRIGDAVFVKRLTSRRRRHFLLSANPRYRAIEVDPEDRSFTILGIVVGRAGAVG